MNKIKSPSKRHHYLSQAYLGGFTDTGKKDGFLFALNLDTGKTFSPTPKNIAVETDFNRVDIEGMPTDALESALAPFEERAVQGIRNTLASGCFPSDEDYSFILNLLCLFAVRNPNLRENFNQAHEASINILTNILVSDEKLYSQQVERAFKDGYIKITDVFYAEMKKFIDNREYTLEFPTEGNTRMEFKAFDGLLKLLAARTWSLLIVPEDCPELICSDHPVALTWKQHSSAPIGYGLPNTEVYFPLSPTACLYGTYEGCLKPVISLTVANVAKVNTDVALNAKRQVYSRRDSFVMWHQGGINEVYCGLRD